MRRKLQVWLKGFGRSYKRIKFNTLDPEETNVYWLHYIMGLSHKWWRMTDVLTIGDVPNPFGILRCWFFKYI